MIIILKNETEAYLSKYFKSLLKVDLLILKVFIIIVWCFVIFTSQNTFYRTDISANFTLQLRKWDLDKASAALSLHWFYVVLLVICLYHLFECYDGTKGRMVSGNLCVSLALLSTIFRFSFTASEFLLCFPWVSHLLMFVS